MMKTKQLLLATLLVVSCFGLWHCGGDDDKKIEKSAVQWLKADAGGRHTYNASSQTAHTCAISTEKTLFCWGAGGEGQLGTGNRNSSSKPVRVGNKTNWTDIAIGGGFSCGIESGNLYCWGSNKNYPKYDNPATVGLLGLGDDFDDVDSVAKPTMVGASSKWVEVDAGTNSACAIKDSNDERKLFCWGRGGSSNALGTGGVANGDGYYGNENKPTEVDGGYTDWASIHVGLRGMAMGIRDSGTERTLWHFGQSLTGLSNSEVPQQVGAFTDWHMGSLGAWEFCGIRKDAGTDDQTLWCFGNNKHGQLGNGDDSTVNIAAIAQIGASTKWSDINMGTGYACGIDDDDLYCWGRNHDNELGLGSDLSGHAACVEHDGSANEPSDCLEPVLVNDSVKWTSLSVGTGQNCGVTDDEDLYCWGENKLGQAGISDAKTTAIKPSKLMVMD